MPRKPTNEKGSKPIKNKSGITTNQVETELKVIKPIEPVAEDYYKFGIMILIILRIF